MMAHVQVDIYIEKPAEQRGMKEKCLEKEEQNLRETEQTHRSQQMGVLANQRSLTNKPLIPTSKLLTSLLRKHSSSNSR